MAPFNVGQLVMADVSMNLPLLPATYKGEIACWPQGWCRVRLAPELPAVDMPYVPSELVMIPTNRLTAA